MGRWWEPCSSMRNNNCSTVQPTRSGINIIGLLSFDMNNLIAVGEAASLTGKYSQGRCGVVVQPDASGRG